MSSHEKATARPWRYDDMIANADMRKKGIKGLVINGPERTDDLSFRVCDLTTGYRGEHEAETRANARLIVTAVNSHQRLVEAANLARATLERIYKPTGPFSSIQGTLDVIDEALRLAQTTPDGGTNA